MNRPRSNLGRGPLLVSSPSVLRPGLGELLKSDAFEASSRPVPSGPSDYLAQRDFDDSRVGCRFRTKAEPLDGFSLTLWRRFLREFASSVQHAVQADPGTWTRAICEGADPGVGFLQSLGFELSISSGRVEMAIPPLTTLLRNYDRLFEGELTGQGFRIFRPTTEPGGNVVIEELGSRVTRKQHPGFSEECPPLHVALFCLPGSVRAGSDYNFGGVTHFVRNLGRALARAGHRVDIVSRSMDGTPHLGFGVAVEHEPGLNNLRIIRLPLGNDPAPRSAPALVPFLDEWAHAVRDFYRAEGLPDVTRGLQELFPPAMDLAKKLDGARVAEPGIDRNTFNIVPDAPDLQTQARLEKMFVDREVSPERRELPLVISASSANPIKNILGVIVPARRARRERSVVKNRAQL